MSICVNKTENLVNKIVNLVSVELMILQTLITMQLKLLYITI
jgi:hypothetical protein